MLLRTTYNSVSDWGVYESMATYQRNFWFQLRDGYETFRERYKNYNFGDLYNATKLAMTRSGGVTNRFYFAFLNDAQWRVIGQAIRRPGDRTRFGRVVGDRLYRAILKGEELRNDLPEGSEPVSEEEAAFNRVGTWPQISQPLPTGAAPADVRQGVTQLLEYLRAQKYCEDFEVSEVLADKDGKLRFTSFVKAPVNLEATASLMRSNENFAPRYDQRILQAYFGDRGLESEFADALANGLQDAPVKGPPGRPAGIRTQWTLQPDPDAGL